MNTLAVMDNLGAAVTYFRKRKHWSQGQLATYSGLSRSQISLMEKGKRGKRSSAATVEKIAKALDISVDELLAWQPDEEFELVQEKWSLLSGEARSRIIGIVREDEKSASAGRVANGVAYSN